MQGVKESMTLKRVRMLLAWWGEYQRALVKAGYRLGYPQTSPCIHIGETRAGLAPMPKPKPIVQKIDSSMMALEKFRADLYMALRFKYEFDRMNQDAAAEMHVSIKTYKGWVCEGECFIAGRIIETT